MLTGRHLQLNSICALPQKNKNAPMCPNQNCRNPPKILRKKEEKKQKNKEEKKPNEATEKFSAQNRKTNSMHVAPAGYITTPNTQQGW